MLLCMIIKITSGEISKRLVQAEQTETMISTERENYRAVAARGKSCMLLDMSILFMML